MSLSRKYTSQGAFRQALEQRLKIVSGQEGTDFQRLFRQVAFDRFLARIAGLPTGNWVLKGGYAMELRFVTARSTRDLDFTLRSGSSLESALDHLQQAGAYDAKDFFSFRVGEATMNLDGAPYGGARYPVESRLDGRTFVKFHIDVGIGDVVLEPVEMINPRDWLSFAGIPSPPVAMIAREQQLAEKIHAYTLPRPSPNSRVRDLVDLYLLTTSGSRNIALCAEALWQTFQRRNTHRLPAELTPPPGDWDRPFRALAEECRLNIHCREAFDTFLEFWTILQR